MTEKVNIKIISTQTTAEGSDTAVFFTCGTMEEKENCVVLCYDENKEMGFEGSTVTLTIEDGKATMERRGKYIGLFIMELEHKHYCNYGTDFGTITFGVAASNVDYCFDSNGTFFAHLKYTLDANSELISENKMVIRVKKEDNNTERKK